MFTIQIHFNIPCDVEANGEIRMNRTLLTNMMIVLLLSASLAGCTGDDEKESLIQTGSSTVLPLAVAWAEEYEGADVSVSGGGSSHGINALLNGEADLGDASRLMKGKDYTKVNCDESGVRSDGTASEECMGVMPTKWVVAFDVLAVITHPSNDFASTLTYDQLYSIFTDDNPAVYWDDVAGLEGAPHEEIQIYAPDEASGTFDYFFEEIIEDWGDETQVAGTRLESGDGVYHPSADDNVIMTAIQSNEYAIGFLGFAYVRENADKVNTVSIDDGSGAVEPSLETVAAYPMGRQLHINTDANAANSDAVNGYLSFALSDEGQAVCDEVGYVKVELVDANLLSLQRAALA